MVEIVTEGRALVVRTQHDEGWTEMAYGLGGSWEEDRWVFDSRDEESVRGLARHIFGSDGSDDDPEAGVTLRVTLSRLGGRSQLDREVRLLGRRLCSRPARDAAVRLGRGVVLAAGRFTARGGSVTLPQIGGVSGVVLEVRDVPAGVAGRLVAEHPDGVRIVEPEDGDALLRRREELVSQLAALDARLKEAGVEFNAFDGWLTAEMVSARGGFSDGTVRSYRHRSRTMPQPTYVGRTPLWRETEIEPWLATRRGAGEATQDGVAELAGGEA